MSRLAIGGNSDGGFYTSQRFSVLLILQVCVVMVQLCRQRFQSPAARTANLDLADQMPG
ncbi:MAG: hypothetical protein ACRDNF_06590 [Streptosporangiaceae bacterium]